MSEATNGIRHGNTKWQPEWDALLGTESDYRLSLRLGVSQQTVVLHRQKCGVAARFKSRKNVWQQEWDDVLRATVDRSADELAAQFGVTRATIDKHRMQLGLDALSKLRVWQDEWTPLLGTMPDRRLAAKLGIEALTVKKYRMRHGVRRFNKATAEARGLHDAELMPSEVAATSERTGIAIGKLNVERRRRRLLARGAPSVRAALLRRAAVAGMVGAFGTEVTLNDMGEALGVTRERVRQILDEVTALLAPLDPPEEQPSAATSEKKAP